MKRLFIPLSVLVVLIAAFILIQPSRALNGLPAKVSSQRMDGIRMQNGLAEENVQGSPNPPWYDPAWAIRRPITINNAGSALTNYQVLVALNSSFDFTHAQADGADLRVTASDGTTALSFWIESWSNTTQKAWVWVMLPSLPAGNTVIYFYYDNPSAAAVSNGKATFDVYDGFETYPVGTTPIGDYGNPGEWTRYPGNPVLTLGAIGTWDATGTTFASVISDTTAGQYRMYYHGFGAAPCGGSCIGLATSSDGRTWAKYVSNPILTPGSSGAWDATGVRVPMVWKEGPNDYRMMYTGSLSGVLQVGYATSTDGINWTKYAGNPVFNDTNSWAHNSTEGWGVIKVGSLYLMWYSDLNAPRESSIATSTDLISWTPYASTPIFASSGVPTDYTYSQFCPYTFTYGGYYYVLVPSYTSVGDYSHYYLYRSSSPYFPTGDRHLVRISHTVGTSGQWDSADSDTPFVLTMDIQRDAFPDNQLWNYYAGASTPGGNVWQEGLMIETDIPAALTDATLPGGTISWEAVGDVTVVDNPVRQGLHSVQLNDTSNSSSTNLRGTIATVVRGSLGGWMRRNNTTAGDYDIYLYQDSTLAAVVGLGRNGKFHYWNKSGGYGTGFHDTAVSWSVDTWYLVTADFDSDTDTYTFVVYDQNLNEIVRQTGISFGNATTGIDAAWFYTDSIFTGHGYADDFRLRKWALTAPTVQIGAAQPVVDLAIDKSASAGTIYVGDSLIYTIRVTNPSLLTAPAVVVTDTLPALVNLVSATPTQGSCTLASPIICTLGDLPGSVSATIQIVVTAATTGVATNTAQVASNAVDQNDLNNTDSVDTTILPKADLSVQLTDHPDPVYLSDPFTYTVSIHNGGPSLAVSVRLTDTLPSGVVFNSATPSQGTCTPGSPLVCNLGDIPSGNNAQVLIRVTTTVEGTLISQATVGSVTHDSALANNSDSETTTVSPSADLDVSQIDTPDPVWAGDPVTYTVTIHNGGPSPAVNVQLNDTLPSGVIFNSATPSQGTCTLGSQLVCNLGILLAGRNAQLLIQVTTTVEGTLTNLGVVSSPTHDPALANNTDSETTSVLPVADLDVSQVDTPDPARVGDLITYTITVHNSGPSVSAQITLNDTLPGSVNFVSAVPSAYCTQTSPVVCTLPGLSSGGSSQVQVVVRTTQNGWLTNTVSVYSSTYDRNMGNNISVETTIVATEADLAISLTDQPDPVYAGDPLTYTIRVHNGGPNIAANIRMTDTLPGGVNLQSATPSQGTCSPGEVVTCELINLDEGEEAIVTIVVTHLEDGMITNRVQVVSDTGDENLGDNQDEETTTVTPVADLSVSQVDQPDPVQAGRPLTYTLTVHNGGPSSSASVTLTDNLDPHVIFISAAPSTYCTQTSPVVCALPGLPSGGSSQVQVVVNTILDGQLTNSVTVASSTYDRNLANNTSLEDTMVATTADLSVTQQAYPNPVIAEQELTYTLTVHNAGPSIAAVVQLTDTLPGGVTPVSATSDQGSCTLGSVITCDLGNLASESDLHVHVVVIPLFEGSITNQVDVATGTFESNLGNNTSTGEATVQALSADLELTLTGSPTLVAAGAFVTYTAQVHNTGPSRAIGPTVTFTLTNEITYVTPTPGCAQQGQKVTCSMAEIPAHGSVNVTLVVQVSSATFAPSITSSASVVSQVADPDFDNNHDPETTSITWQADLSIDILDHYDPVGVTKVILTYTLVYTNYGPSDAINLSLTDALPANVEYSVDYSDPACKKEYGKQIVICDLNDLPALQRAEIVVAVEVGTNVTSTLENQVDILAQTSDPGPHPNHAVEMTSIDPVAPLAGWIAPVKTGNVFTVVTRPGMVVTLVVTATDNLAVNYVQFRLWDYQREDWIILGIAYQSSPNEYTFVWALDTGPGLLPSANEIDAFVYDTAGNLTRVYIFINHIYPLFLPINMK